MASNSYVRFLTGGIFIGPLYISNITIPLDVNHALNHPYRVRSTDDAYEY